MKTTTGNKMKLGILVTVAFLLLIACIYFIGQKQQLFSNTFRVRSVFKDISGLQVGNNVRFSGLNVGIIIDIQQITDSTVSVEMRIKEDTHKFIKKDAKAVIGSDGLMGNKIIEIIPGTGTEAQVSDHGLIANIEPVKMDEVMRQAALITTDFSLVMQNIREGKGTIGKLLMDSVLADNVEAALVNIKKGAGGFKENMDAASHNILLRGYLKKKARAKENKLEEKEEARQDAK